MEKKIRKNGVTFVWDDEQTDMLATNALYKFLLPNKQIYYGSAELLIDRVISHCTHVNSKISQERLFNSVLKKYKLIKVSLVEKYDTIKEAREAEKRFIPKMADIIYSKLGNIGDYETIVHKVMLNAELYTSYRETYPHTSGTFQTQCNCIYSA